jgi:uncharacterized protein
MVPESRRRWQRGCHENLGELYYYGRGVARDYTQARDWYEKAAAADNANAMCSLGWMYEKGSGVIVQDYTQAGNWYQRAAEAGNTEAMYNLGVFYQNGQGVPQNYDQAREWFQKAAEAGNMDAMNSLNELYSCAQGVARDYTPARNWYQGAVADSTEAMCNLGALYQKAMYNLGVLYENGHGVAQDYVKAREWYQLAANLGDTDAKQALSRSGQAATSSLESSTPRPTQKVPYKDETLAQVH